MLTIVRGEKSSIRLRGQGNRHDRDNDSQRDVPVVNELSLKKGQKKISMA